MAVRRLLLDTLEGLSQDDFERFNWGLVNCVLGGCEQIPLARLVKAKRWDTVDVMTRCYGEEMAVNVTVENLKEMRNNNAAETLKNKYAALGTTAAASTSAAAAPPAAAAAAPPAVTMTAQQEGVLIAPTVTGGSIGTLNINFSKP